MGDAVDLLPWDVALNGSAEAVDAIYTYGHPPVDGGMLDRLPGLRVISNYGVGVDHIVVARPGRCAGNQCVSPEVAAGGDSSADPCRNAGAYS